jgi:hypothetical protein
MSQRISRFAVILVFLTCTSAFAQYTRSAAVNAPVERMEEQYRDDNGELKSRIVETRAILDGGFTCLYMRWDTAGTGRYVKNAAAWLANAERFGDAVVAKKTAVPN